MRPSLRAGCARLPTRRFRASGHSDSGVLMSSTTNDREGSLSGLTEREAKEFHSIFVSSFVLFLIICGIGHLFVWFLWRPWIPGPHGYSTAMLDHARLGIQMLTAHIG